MFLTRQRKLPFLCLLFSDILSELYINTVMFKAKKYQRLTCHVYFNENEVEHITFHKGLPLGMWTVVRYAGDVPVILYDSPRTAHKALNADCFTWVWGKVRNYRKLPPSRLLWCLISQARTALPTLCCIIQRSSAESHDTSKGSNSGCNNLNFTNQPIL